jgi:hypothetical protein
MMKVSTAKLHVPAQINTHMHACIAASIHQESEPGHFGSPGTTYGGPQGPYEIDRSAGAPCSTFTRPWGLKHIRQAYWIEREAAVEESLKRKAGSSRETQVTIRPIQGAPPRCTSSAAPLSDDSFPCYISVN